MTILESLYLTWYDSDRLFSNGFPNHPRVKENESGFQEHVGAPHSLQRYNVPLPAHDMTAIIDGVNCKRLCFDEFIIYQHFTRMISANFVYNYHQLEQITGFEIMIYRHCEFLQDVEIRTKFQFHADISVHGHTTNNLRSYATWSFEGSKQIAQKYAHQVVWGLCSWYGNVHCMWHIKVIIFYSSCVANIKFLRSKPWTVKELNKSDLFETDQICLTWDYSRM